MALSLLAHLYSYIRGSQEDVATLSLQYILKQSPDLNAAFTRLVSKALQAEPGEEIHYVCQRQSREKKYIMYVKQREIIKNARILPA